MKFNIGQTIVGIFGCIAVGTGLWITKDAGCLWALILVCWLVESAK